MNRMYTNRFRNELGHDIYVRVGEKELGGVPGILFYISGPDSDTEIHITHNEALELMSGLAKMLKPKSRK